MTIEELIEATDKKGWRLLNLTSFYDDTKGERWLCQIERKEKGDDSAGVYARGVMCSTALEAVQSAYEKMLWMRLEEAFERRLAV